MTSYNLSADIKSQHCLIFHTYCILQKHLTNMSRETKTKTNNFFLFSGIDVQFKCWDKSAHVLHFKEHPEEYTKEVDKFLEKLELNDH